jgi:predicted nucleotidyltransferase
VANRKSSTREIVARYIQELERNEIHIMEAFIFGSHAKGHIKEDEIRLLIPQIVRRARQFHM